MILTILADLRSSRSAVEEQKEIWLYELLYFLGMDVDTIKELPGDLVVEYLMKNHISITDYPSMGALKVEYREEIDKPLKIIGEWAGAEYNIKKDKETGELYYEILIECWSIIDESISME